MEENKIKEADIQLIDNYVKDSYFRIHKKPEKNKCEIQVELEIRMSEIKKVNEDGLGASIILIQNINLINKESKEHVVELGVQMLGQFKGKNLNEEQFIERLKYNGAPLLSQLIRSYIITMTSVGGIEPIRIPMINFVEVFKNEADK